MSESNAISQFIKTQQSINENTMKFMTMIAQTQEQILEMLKENKKAITQNALTPEQLDELKRGVMRATKPLAEVHNFSWGDAMRKVYQELNGRMGVFSYYQISPSDYEEALALLERMRVQKEEQLITGEVKTFLSVNVEIVESKDERY